MATALIQFTQGANTDAAGKAVLGDYGDFSAVTVTNGSNTGVVSWKIYLLDAPPDSATFPPGSQPQILAQAVDNTPTVGFTPDVAGSYRIMLEVTDASSAVDRDIRCFGIPDERGFVRPPYQQNPEPLPLALPGIISRDPRPIKPDEQNYGANVRGWSGNGTASQLDSFFRQYGDLPFQTVTTSPFTASALQPPLYVIDTETIGGPATFNLPLSPRTGFVVRLAVFGTTGDSVTIEAQGGGNVGSARGGATIDLSPEQGAVLVHQGGDNWVIHLRSGSGGSIEPLSNTLYVDPGTTAVAQDGSQSAPFDTLTAAITAAASGDAILVVPGDYSAEAPFTIGKNLTIASVSPTPVGIAGLGSFYNGVVTLGDVTVSAGFALFGFGLNIATLDLVDSTTGAALDSCGVTAITGDGNINAWNTNLPLPLEGVGLYTYNCQLTGTPSTITLTGAGCDLAYSQFGNGSAGTIEFTGAAGTLNVDNYTNYWIGLLEAGAGFTLTNGQKTVIGVELTNLDRVWYVDSAAPTAGNGNIESPFDSLDTAIDVAEADPGSVFFRTLICHGSFAETLTFTDAIKLTSIAPNQRFIWAGDVEFSDAAIYSVYGARVETANVVEVSDVSGTLIADHCELREITGIGGANLIDTTATDVTLNVLTLLRSTVNGAVAVSDTGDGWVDSTVTGDVSATSSGLRAERCTFVNDITVNASLQLVNCHLGGGSTLTCGDLSIDAITYDRLVNFGVAVVAGSIHIIGLVAALQSTAWDATAPEVVTVLAAGHPAGVYLVTGSAIVTDAADTGTLARTVDWVAPTYGADSHVIGAVSATTTGSKFQDSLTIVSDGSTAVTVTFAGIAITGTVSVDLYVTAVPQGTSA